MAHRTETGAAMITWRGAGAPPPPPMPIDLSGLAYVAKRLSRLSRDLSEREDMRPPLVAGELEGLSRRVNQALRDYVLAVIRRGDELWPKIEEAAQRKQREKGDALTADDLLRLEPVREFFALSEELHRCVEALGS